MKVTELTKDQLIILKQSIVTNEELALGQEPSMEQLANADNLVTDEECFTYFKGYSFTEDDFS